jgi:hypothetical protein
MSKRLVRAILRDCEGELDELLPRMRRYFLPQYIGRVARLLPKVNEARGVDLDGSDEAALASVLCGAAPDTARRGEPRGPGGRHAGRGAP